MNTITEAYVDSLAPNAGAIKNGRDLVRKNSFPVRCITEDRTLLFGECKGSGKEPYRCSVDFIQENSPVFRCTCPSRQFPCKHTLGLLYAYASSSSSFEIKDIPAEIADKRNKAEKREEKKQAADKEGTAKAPRKVNKSALVKKIAAQLEGLAILDKLVLQIVHHGLGSIDKKMIQLIEEQAKQLGNYYIPGAQAALRELLLLREDGDREASYGDAIEQLIYLQALVKKSRAYLEQRAEQPDLPMDTGSTLEELLGHAWQLTELRELGRSKTNTELLQLAFLSYADHASNEFVDHGWWIDLEDGTIRVTRHMRPFRAAKQMKEEDSFFSIVQTEELLIYPGERNARVRWEHARYRPIDEADYHKVKQLAEVSYPDVIKKVKNQIKNPLSDKMPAALVAYQSIERVNDDTYILRDAQNKQIPLASNLLEAPQQPPVILGLLQPEELRNQAALIVFRHELESGRLVAQIMSIVTDRRLIRLLY